MATVQTRAGGIAQAELTYRACTTVEDFQQCVQVQKAVWNFADVDLMPTRLFVVAEKIGGQNFGAFEPSGRLVGFVLSLPGLRHGKPYFHSHMLGVLAEYQDRGVGRTLKLMQRSDALERSIRLVEWTFDPLELKNAFFNLERLGVVVRRYVPNHYGTSSSALQAGLPTDRLVAEWWVDTPRVVRVLGGGQRSSEAALRIEVPPDIGQIKRDDRDRAYEIQQRLGGDLQKAFSEGWVLTGFDKKGAYLLEKLEVPAL